MQGGADLLDGGVVQVRRHGQGQYLRCAALGYWEGVRGGGEVAKSFLLMKRQRVVDAAADAALGEGRAQPFAVGGADRVLVIDRFRPGAFARQQHR